MLQEFKRLVPSVPSLAESASEAIIDALQPVTRLHGTDEVILAALALKEQALITQPAHHAASMAFVAVPAGSGAYVFTDGATPVYAGCTIQSLRGRFKNFFKKIVGMPEMRGVQYRHVSCAGAVAVALERALIDHYRPRDQGKGLGNNALGKTRATQKDAAYLRPAMLSVAA